MLLECTEIAELTELALMKHPEVLTENSALSIYLWAHKIGLKRLADHSALYVSVMRETVSLDAIEGPPLAVQSSSCSR